MKPVKAKCWIIIGNFFFNTYYTWMIFIFSMEAFTLSSRKFENWSSEQGSFGTDSFFNNITEILVENISN